MDRMYIEKKKGRYYVMFERCHSELLDHYTCYSVTTGFDTKEKAYSHMYNLSKHTDIKVS